MVAVDAPCAAYVATLPLASIDTNKKVKIATASDVVLGGGPSVVPAGATVVGTTAAADGSDSDSEQ